MASKAGQKIFKIRARMCYVHICIDLFKQIDIKTMAIDTTRLTDTPV
jgi:hypothetical protein